VGSVDETEISSPRQDESAGRAVRPSRYDLSVAISTRTGGSPTPGSSRVNPTKKHNRVAYGARSRRSIGRFGFSAVRNSNPGHRRARAVEERWCTRDLADPRHASANDTGFGTHRRRLPVSPVIRRRGSGDGRSDNILPERVISARGTAVRCFMSRVPLVANVRNADTLD